MQQTQNTDIFYQVKWPIRDFKTKNNKEKFIYERTGGGGRRDLFKKQVTRMTNLNLFKQEIDLVLKNLDSLICFTGFPRILSLLVV